MHLCSLLDARLHVIKGAAVYVPTLCSLHSVVNL